MTAVSRIYTNAQLRAPVFDGVCPACHQPVPGAALVVVQRCGGQYTPVPIARITALLANTKYVEIFTAAGSAGLVDDSLRHIEARYPGRWLRVRRHALILPAAIERITRHPHGRWKRMTATVAGAGEVAIGRRRHHAVLVALEQLA